MATRLATSELQNAIDAQPRAILYVSVDWSGPERVSRKVFRAFADALAASHPELSISFWVIDEHCPDFNGWFKRHRLDGLSYIGFGEVIWLEHGKAVANQVNAGYIGEQGLLKQTLTLWNDPV
jgi:hypothetical protein